MSDRRIGPGPELPGHRHVRPLGEGGCATVHLYERLGQTERLNRQVAIKILDDGGVAGEQFALEAESMIKLGNHPNIVQVFDVAVTPDGRRYFAMQYYPGGTMAGLAGTLPVSEVLEIGVKVASAVETAHRVGILHRDLKPANILVDEYGQPALADFGIAGQVAAGGRDGVGMSVPWSPPEVLDEAEPDRRALFRADVYSLAATLWHLLVGRSPFADPQGDNGIEAITRRVRSDPRPRTGRADVPPSLDALLVRAMAVNPLARPESALAFAHELQAVEQELGLQRTRTVLGTGRAPAPAPTGGAGGEHTRLRAPAVVVDTATPGAAT
ncbi:MAG TPA: serine/threonine-protein kinase, partial [Pseudonocardiaceae bacterium]